MKTTYLGLELPSPVIAGSSPYTASLSNLERCAAAGAGAVVLKSIFEEQILHESASMERYSESVYGDAAGYLERYLGEDYKARTLQLLRDASSRLAIPVIGSINCIGTDDRWTEYAAAMEQAGAAALELNIFLQPTDPRMPAATIEGNYLEIAAKVTARVTIPVAVKLPLRFTNMLHVADGLLARGVRGAVCYNRFFEPDIDIERIAFTESSPYSEPAELRNVLRSVGIASAVLPQLDFAVSTGVHDGPAAVKALLCGARAVEICTAIHNTGYEAFGRINSFIDAWAADHGFRDIGEFRGRLDFRNHPTELYQRVQYMKYYPISESSLWRS